MPSRFRGGGGFNPFSAGDKVYGSGMNSPTIGPVDPTGYRERDLRTRARRNAILRRLQAGQSQQFMSSDYLRRI